MLILSRRTSQRIVIDEGRIVITVVEIQPGKVRLGVKAPPDCRVDREEIDIDRKVQRAAAEGEPDDREGT